MHPHHHSLTSVKIWGGCVEDYAPIHDWFDATKEQIADARHRALRHHSQGIFEAERVFGRTIVNSDGRAVPVRYIGEQHVKEDCGGRIPTVADWFRNIPLEGWMSRSYRIEPAEGAGMAPVPAPAPAPEDAAPRVRVYRTRDSRRVAPSPGRSD
jgi:hypothetical protein